MSKPVRYWPGKAPQGYKQEDSEEESDTNELQSNIQQNSKSFKKNSKTSTITREAHIVISQDVTSDKRLQRILNNSQSKTTGNRARDVSVLEQVVQGKFSFL